MPQSRYSETVVYPVRLASLIKIIHSHKHLPINRKYTFVLHDEKHSWKLTKVKSFDL